MVVQDWRLSEGNWADEGRVWRLSIYPFPRDRRSHPLRFPFASCECCTDHWFQARHPAISRLQKRGFGSGQLLRYPSCASVTGPTPTRFAKKWNGLSKRNSNQGGALPVSSVLPPKPSENSNSHAAASHKRYKSDERLDRQSPCGIPLPANTGRGDPSYIKSSQVWRPRSHISLVNI